MNYLTLKPIIHSFNLDLQYLLSSTIVYRKHHLVERHIYIFHHPRWKFLFWYLIEKSSTIKYELLLSLLYLIFSLFEFSTSEKTNKVYRYILISYHDLFRGNNECPHLHQDMFFLLPAKHLPKNKTHLGT